MGRKFSQIQSSPNRARPPHFEDLDDEVFEEFSCALLEKEANVIKADLYKARRQKQFGVDALGELKNNQGIDVISCKVRKTLKKGDIPAFGDEFLDHWDTHWKTKKVKKFILAVTYAVNSAQREAEIQAEILRFKQKGIEYEVWPPRTLQAKVRPYRDIASQYLGENIANDICGRTQAPTAPKADNQSSIDSSILQELMNLKNVLSEKIDKQLQEVREKIKRKEGNDVDDLLNEIETNVTQWASLQPNLKAAVKRLQASRAINKNDIPLAKTLCAEAEGFDRNQITNLKALITLVETGAKDALKILKNANTPDELKLKAGLELTVVSPKRALTTLKLLPKKEKDGEVLRLSALAYLMQGARDKAIQNIEEAEKNFNEWYAVQRTAVAIKFHLSFSPCVPFQLSAWPNPIIPELIKEDKATHEHLATGLSTLEKLLDKVEDDDDEYKDLQIWKLAYLSNIKSKSIDAEKYAEELLKIDPACAGVVTWSLARGYRFDVHKSKSALQKLVKKGAASIEQILCLLSIYHFEGDNSAATEVLKNTQGEFDTPELKGTWEHWNSKCNLDGFKKTQTIDEQLALLIGSQNWNDLADFLQSADKKNLHEGHIFVACLNFAQHNQWPLIKPYLDVLIDDVATPSAIKIASICAYNTGDALQVKNILENKKYIFEYETLPVDMRKLYNRALFDEGDLIAAIADGDQLIAETNNINDRLEQINNFVAMGDVPSAIYHIQAMTNRQQLPAQHALQLSNIIEKTDPSLANQLFQQINIEELSDDILGSYLSLSYRLGYDDSPVQEIFRRMEHSSTPDLPLIRKFDISEVKHIIHEQNKQSEYIDNLYKEGSVPLHLILSRQNTNFSDLIFGNLADKIDQDLPQKSKLLFRFGGRTPNLDIDLESAHLYLDVGSVLLVYKLDLIDLIEQNTASINISPHLQTALIEMENEFTHHQSARLETMKEIVLSVEKGEIKTISKNTANTFDILSGDQRTFAVYHDKNTVEEESQSQYEIINIKQVIDDAYQIGCISSQKFGSLKRAIPNVMNSTQSEPILQNGDRLIFEYNTLEVLASENLLFPMLKTFDIYIDQTYINDAKAEIAVNDQRKTLANEVAQLRQSIVQKLKGSQYRVFAQSNMETVPNSQHNTQNQSENCLTDLVRLKQKENRIVWADDRAINRHTSVNGNIIVDTYDIINLLMAQGVIDSDHFYDLLISLRKANYYYIPVTAEEILHHLQKSNIKNEKTQETEELQIIRQYISMIAIQEDFLYFDYQNKEAFDEKKLLVSTFTLADKSILSVWSNASSTLETKQAHSAWIWDSIRLEHLKRVPVHQATDEGYECMYVLLLTGLLTNSIQIPPEGNMHKNYMEWLKHYILDNAMEANPDIHINIAESISSLLLNLFENHTKTDANDEKIVRAYLSRIVQLLPDSIQEHIIKNTKLSKILGLTRINYITVENKNIEPIKFWKGAYHALETGPAEIEIHKSKEKLHVHLLENKNQPVFSLNSEGTETLTDPIFSFLSPKEKDLFIALENNKDWFEYPKKNTDKIRKKILEEKDVTKRMGLVEHERKDAPAYKYAMIEQRLLDDSSYDYSELNPAPIDRLLHHLRLNETRSKSIETRINKAAEKMISAEGIVAAFRMFSGLPFYMPKPIINELLKLKPKTLSNVLKSMHEFCHSPLRIFHLLYIARITQKRPRDLEFINEKVSKLENQGLQLCEAYLCVIRYFEKIFSQNPEWIKLDAHEKIITYWYHSDQIINLLIGYGMPLEDFKAQFVQRHVPSSNYQLLQDKNYRAIPYSPSNINAKNLFFTGMKMSFGDECTTLLSDAERNKVKDLFTFKDKDQTLTDISIMRDTSEYSSPLPSFVSESSYDFALNLGGEEFAKWLSNETITELTQEIYDKLQDDPNIINYWLHLNVLYNAGLFPQNAKKILKLASGLDFYTFLKNKTDFSAFILQYVSEAINIENNDELTQSFKASLLETTKRMSYECKRPLNIENYDQKDWVNNAAISLSEAILTLSRKDTMEETLNELSKNVIEMCTIWPSLAPLWRKTLNSIIENFDFPSSTVIWDTQIKLRTMA